MRRLILLSVVCFFTIGILNAQIAKVSRVNSTTFPALTNEITASVDPSLTYLSYCDDYVEEGGIGSPLFTTISSAIYYSAANLKEYAGRKIYALNIGLAAHEVKDFSVFITNSLTGEPLVVQEVNESQKGWNSVILTSPFEITGEEELYIGYTCYGYYPVGISGRSYQNSTYIKISESGEWDNFHSQNIASLCIQAFVPEDETPEREMGIVNVNTTYSAINDPVIISGKVKNNTLTPVTSYEISYQIGEGEKVSKKIDTSLDMLQEEDFVFELESSILAEVGKYEVTVTIERVNDEEDEYTSNNTETGEINRLKYIFPKKVVIEEGTGTWCQWCPSGFVGMAMMKEKYPDTFIGIAVHNRDRMTVNTYDTPLSRFFSGYPKCVASRKTTKVGDPLSEIEDFYLSEMEIPAEVGISLEVNWVEGSTNEIEVTTNTTFGFSSEDTNNTYRLAYVIIENGVTGYTQSNAYAGVDWGHMGGFESLPTNASVEFNDVARAIHSSFNGITNSIPEEFRENEPIIHQDVISLPTTIQDYSELEVVVLLLNVNTGEIINADKVELEYDLTNINNSTASTLNAIVTSNSAYLSAEIESEGEVFIELYNLEGMLVNSFVTPINGKEIVNIPLPNKGAYIIKVSNSKESVVQKVIL